MEAINQFLDHVIAAAEFDLDTTYLQTTSWWNDGAGFLEFGRFQPFVRGRDQALADVVRNGQTSTRRKRHGSVYRLRKAAVGSKPIVERNEWLKTTFRVAHSRQFFVPFLARSFIRRKALSKEDFFLKMNVALKATQDPDPNEGPDNVDHAVASFFSNFFPRFEERNADPSGRPFAPGTHSWPLLNDEIYKYYDYLVDDDGWEGITKIEDLHRADKVNWRAGPWWVHNEGKNLPLLAALAEKVLAVAITTAEVERCFNHLRWMEEAGGRGRMQGDYIACEMSVNVDRIRPT